MGGGCQYESFTYFINNFNDNLTGKKRERETPKNHQVGGKEAQGDGVEERLMHPVTLTIACKVTKCQSRVTCPS